MIARMNLKRSQRILSKRRSDSSKEKKVSKKPFVNLQLTYYYLLIRQTGRLYSTILKKTGYHIRRKKRLPTALLSELDRLNLFPVPMFLLLLLLLF